MHEVRSGMVEILRDFLVAHEMLTDVLQAFREGSLRFENVQQLVGGDDASVLFRLKERSHSIFRREGGEVLGAVRREELFDLAVGSLFHEAMKLRENLYQQEVYRPRVEVLREQAGSETGTFFEEFDRILKIAESRLEEALEETEALLAQTQQQLRLLIRDHRQNGLIARALCEEHSLVAKIFSEGLEALLTEIYGSAEEGFVVAASSYLESAHFAEALAVLRDAEAGADDPAQIQHLAFYAEGMRAFLAGDHPGCLRRLREWVMSATSSEPSSLAKMALAVVSQLVKVASEGGDSGLLDEAKKLAERLREFTPTPAES